MEEYIRLEEEKARRRGKVYNWETTTYGNIWYDEDVHDLRFIETEFLVIVLDDAFTSEQIYYSPNTTMEEYIRLEEEKARRRGKVYNWETTTYGNIWYDEDVHDLTFIETEFLAIVFDDAFTSEVTFSYEPTISPF
nr:hypothetical protein [Tanacetum cinerariifolium]